MPPEIRRITEQFLHNPVKVEVSRPASTVATTTQLLAKTGRDPAEKRETLRQLIRSADGLKNAIIFCNRKREVAQLHRSLLRHKFSAVALHGDMDQSARTAALDQFRKNEVTLLVASDVAARGLDIPAVSHVFNFDVPHHAEDYVHRIGRTGRAGRTGVAITITAPGDQKSVAAIESLIGQPIPWMGEPPTTAEQEAAPATTRRGDQRGGSRHRRPEPAHRPEQPPARRPETNRPREQTHVARLDDARPPRNPPRPEEPDNSHLPAFLLRPFRVKA